MCISRVSNSSATPCARRIKMSQGAKPGHGGILPKHKVTKEIAETRGIRCRPCIWYGACRRPKSNCFAVACVLETG
ncbi:hypothetical protein FQ187_05290 [Pseudomonas sp. ANT_J28]|nr:hypothetical protein FQ187_05290 [Pseudomonas sp. ANT_J28]